MPLKTGSLLETILAALDDAKAEDISALDLEGRSSLADHMVVATGRSDRHVGAVADRVARALKDNGFPTPRIEGLGTCEWVLIDAGDIIVHVFKPEARSFYNLERLWGADRPAEQKQGRADSARP
ncbi:MAG: ribosome silencing factor [Proteobacteria bacterium]|nr:ribosome silencing factor [Pseudomonadota bacterium]